MSLSHRNPASSPAQHLRRPHKPPPAPCLPAGRQDLPTVTRQGHAEHFLLRVMRCEGTDLQRAMRLYNYAYVVRVLVTALMTASALVTSHS